MDRDELEILQILDIVAKKAPVRAMINSVVLRVEQKLMESSGKPLLWQPVPLAAYGVGLPGMIRSSWMFVLRARANTGAERHPNSCQRMMSYRGSGDLQIWTGESMPSNREKKWYSNTLVSDLDAQIESRWISIPPNTWHRAVVPQENWVVVSFHTVTADELIEERPSITDTELTHQRKYLDG